MADDGGLGEPQVLWAPDPATVPDAVISRFTRWLADRQGLRLEGYQQLHDWSVRDLGGFWSAVAQFHGVDLSGAHAALEEAVMPGARWFPGAQVSYAEHALTPGPGRGEDDTALVLVREDGIRRQVSHGELRQLVGRARAGLQRLGVGQGDRVVALAPNCAQTVVAFLATASLGAIWSACSPDFGTRAVLDRFTQLDPTVLVAVDGYRYGGRRFSTEPALRAIRAGLPGLRATVLVPYLDDPPDESDPRGAQHAADPSADPSAHSDPETGLVSWAQLIGTPGPVRFDRVPFEHPLWVLYSSGTTGLPKGIVHSHGGILLEHLKALSLQADLGPGDRFCWFTTTGWMMWNFLVGGLLVGATVVLFDGSPAHPGADALWALAARERVTYLGTSAPFVQACLKAGLRPGAEHDLSALRAVGSTGSPLTAEGFQWLHQQVSADLQICSVSGGTDVCTAFLGSAPTVPVWSGELSCAALGADVAAFDDAGRPVQDQVGELVLRAPMPSMPVSFWDDPDGERLREAYFAMYPGVWRHGDWVRRTDRGSFVIYGRSDSTLNRGGVRMGTADFYAVVEADPGVADSLVVDTTELGRDGTEASPGALVCFVVLAAGATLEEVADRLRTTLRRELSPRHVPDRFVAVPAVPRTLNGKKCEVPVKRILAGADPGAAVSAGALADPQALQPYLELARRGL